MTTKTTPFFKTKATEWETVGEGIFRQFIGYSKDLMLVKVKFETGAIGALHSHIHTQGSYVASGKFKITIDGKSEILETGDGFFVTPDIIHGAECLASGILIDVFNPVREDFLDDA